MDNFDLKKYLAEGRLFENEYFDVYHEAGDKLENHPNYNKLVSILKDKGFEPDGNPYSDGTGRRDVHGVWDVFKSYTTEPGARGTTLTKANAKDINDALRQAGIEDIKATPSNSYSFRLKVNNLAEGKLLKEELRDIEDILVKAGFRFDDGLLGGVGSGGAGYYDLVNDAIYGYNQSGPWNEEEFNKFYNNFSFNSNVYEKEFAEENDYPYDFDMVAQMVKPGMYAVGDDGYVEIRSNGDIEIYAIPQLSDEDGREFLPAFKMDASGRAIPQFSKDEMRKKLKDDMYYII